MDLPDTNSQQQDTKCLDGGEDKVHVNQATAANSNAVNFENLWEHVKILVGGVKHLDEDELSQIEASFKATDISTEPAADETALTVSHASSDVDHPADEVEFEVPATLGQVGGSSEKSVEDSENVEMVLASEETMIDSMQLDDEVMRIQMPSKSTPFLQPLKATEPSEPEVAARPDDGVFVAKEVDEDDESFNDSSDDEDEEKETGNFASTKRIDIRDLASILQNGKHATQDISSGADVVFVIGATGVGKSTLIQAIAGHKIKLGFDQSLNRKSYVVDGEGETDFDIGHGMISKTRHVRSFFRGSSSTFYVDSSGFDDTKGIETDIATSICIREIASRAKRVRFVVLINAYTFYVHRATELRKHLSLVANFVGHNFNTFKQSFTFLFTHCNKAFDSVPSEIDESSADNEQILTSMRNEVEILLGSLKKETQEVRLKNLISFLRSSLKKGYPYCDVFDPILSDMSKIIKDIEPSTTKHCIIRPADCIKCSLTSSSRLSLSQELTQRQEYISNKLEEGAFDAEMQEDARAVLTLATQIDEDICRGPAQAVLKMLTDARTAIKNRLFEAVCAGLLDEMNSDLNDAEDAETTKDGIKKLRFLGGLIDQYHFELGLDESMAECADNTYQALLSLLEEQKEYIERHTSQIGEYVSAGCSFLDTFEHERSDDVEQLSLRIVAVKLQKLQAWAQVFEGDVAELYRSALSRVHDVLSSIICDVQDREGGKLLPNGESSLRALALIKHASSLGILGQVACDSSDKSLVLGDAVAMARDTALSCLKAVKEAVKDASADSFRSQPTVASPHDNGQSVFLGLQTAMNQVQKMHLIIEGNDLRSDVQDARPRDDAMKTVIVEFVQHCELCERLIDSLDCQKATILHLCFRSLNAFVGSLHSSMRAEGRLQASLERLYRCFASRLRDLVGVLKVLGGQLDSNGVTREQSEGAKKGLMTLRSCCWFDEVLRLSLSEEGFVAEAVREAQETYSAYGDIVAREMMVALNQVTSGMDTANTVQDNAKFIRDSSKTLFVVSSVIDSNHFDEFSTKLRNCVQQWAKECQAVEFPATVQEVPFDKVDVMLLIVEHLKSIDSEADRNIDALESFLRSELANYTEGVLRIISGQGNFAAKRAVLDTSIKWSKYPSLGDLMPSHEDLRRNVRKNVVQHAEDLHKRINKAEDLNMADVEKEIELLLKATKEIDLYIDGEASRWCDTVLRVYETRQEEVDEKFLGMIDSNDFTALKAFLSPLRASNDPRKHARYRKCVKVISVNLWQRVEVLRSIVTTARGSRRYSVKDVTTRIQALDEAEVFVEKNIGKLVPPVADGAPWSLSTENAATKNAMKEALEESLAQASVAVESLDFAVAVESSRHAALLHEVLKPSRKRLSFTNNKKSAELQAKVSSLRGKVSGLLSQVDVFVRDFLQAIDSPLEESRHGKGSHSGRNPADTFPPETISLRRALDQLKTATEHSSECDDTLVQCYGMARSKLSKGLNVLYQRLEAEVQESRFSRPLKILGFLRDELVTRGLEEHVDIEFDVLSAIADITDQKDQHYRAIRLDDARIVDRVAQDLDHLSRYGGYWYRSDYEELKHQVLRFVNQVLRETRGMMKNLELNGLRGRVAVIACIQQKLTRHLALRDGFAKEIQEAFSLRCSSFFADMKASLENGYLDHFQALFTLFHGLMVDVPLREETTYHDRQDHGHLVEQFDEVCRALQHNVHSMLLDQTKTKLGGFQRRLQNHEFVEAAAEAEKLRDLGYFLSSSFEYYRVESCRGLVDIKLQELVSLIRSEFGSKRFLTFGRSMAVLCLTSSSTVEDVRKAYKKQGLRWHPDKNRGDVRAAEKFVAIKDAKDLLSDRSNLEYYQGYDFLFLVQAIRSVPRQLLEATRCAVDAGEFHMVANIYNKLHGVPSIAAAARDPKKQGSIKVERIATRISNLVQRTAAALCVDIKKAWANQDFVELHHSFVSLESLEKAFKAHSEVVPDSFTSGILHDLNSRVSKLQEDFIDLRGKDELTASRSIKEFGLQLIEIGRILDGFPRLKKKTRDVLYTILSNCRDEPWGVSFIFRLGIILENGELSDDEEYTRVGRVIVNSFSHFEDVRRVAFRREVITAPVSESIKGFETKRFTKSSKEQNIKIDQEGLEQEYHKYEKLFHECFNKYVDDGHDDLVQYVYAMVAELGSCRVANWSASLKAKLTEVVAAVFAAFTIIKSGESFKRFTEQTGGDNGETKAEDLLFQPHNIQVLAILRLLGIGDPTTALQNHVMEIRTGEGKSIVLGALSVVLALLGFTVRCVCYSEHLSERDSGLFQDVFAAFGVQDRIVYSKITTMSEDSVAAKGDVRHLTLNLMHGKSSAKNLATKPPPTPRSITSETKTMSTGKDLVGSSTGQEESSLERNSEFSARALKSAGEGLVSTEVTEFSTESHTEYSPLPLNGDEILLVDEVDVFFGPDFYGQTYNQIAELEDPTVEKLLKKIWERRREKPSFSNVRSWSEYSVLTTKFPKWVYQIETEVRSMCADVENYKDPPYEVDTVNSRIGYSNKDSVDWDVVYGYRTAFAHLHEFERGRLKGSGAEANLRRALSLRVSCGQFSYARIAPTRILGVSGTLRALTTAEKEIVKEFGVDTYSLVPSVYGPNNLRFDKAGQGIVVENDKSRYLQAIANEVHIATSKGGAAIVFFENDERLAEFKKSTYWRDIRHGNVLSSTANGETRNYVIKKAATSGQVTIATAAFGRGTDFFCKDSKLEAAGGLLVIQTFLSVEKSEELQIRGRTARQGKKGSYMLLLLESDLCSLIGIKPGECASKGQSDLYDWLDKRREAVHRRKLSETRELVVEADERDQVSRAYLDALIRGDQRGAKRCLDSIYKGIRSRSRKLKYSRMVCLSDATGSMHGIWSATRNCIREMLRRIDEIGEGQFEIMWVAYRDYSDGGRLLQKSRWSKNPKDLEAFVSTIVCDGGGDYPEAVEWALKAVNEEHDREPVTRVLLIADAPPHFESKGEILSSHNNHVMATDFKTEAEKLKRNGIPVYTFRLNEESQLVSSFQRIASITGGESHALDFSGGSGAQKLIDCVCETALEDIGGSELLAEYKARNWN